MPCPKCGSSSALIWIGVYEDHICTECDTWYHEDNESERFKKEIEILEIKISKE